MSEEVRPAEEEAPSSRLQQYLYGWWFRSSKPKFREGDEFEVYVFDYDEEERKALARVGDTRLNIPDVPPEIAGKRVRVRVTDFDEATSIGEAEVLETVGETTFG